MQPTYELSISFLLRPKAFSQEMGVVTYDVCAYVESSEQHFGKSLVTGAQLITIMPADRQLTHEDIKALNDLRFVDDVCGVRGADGNVYQRPLPGFHHRDDYACCNVQNGEAIAALIEGHGTLSGPFESRRTIDMDVIELQSEECKEPQLGLLMSVKQQGREVGRYIVDTRIPANALDPMPKEVAAQAVLATALHAAPPYAKPELRQYMSMLAKGTLRLDPHSAISQGRSGIIKVQERSVATEVDISEFFDRGTS